jgi:hypothetical protein
MDKVFASTSEMPFELRGRDSLGADPTFSELAREKMWARIYLTPLLQAEEDRDAVRRHFARQAMEKELLGKEFPAYNTDRWVLILRVVSKHLLMNFCSFIRPTYAVVPEDVSK